SSSEARDHGSDHSKRSRAMTTSQWKALGAAAFLLLGATGCTDPTVAPKSSVTDANFFNDPNSYRALLAKIYAGLALTGQQGPAGQPDIQSIDEGFSQYLRLYWQLEELPTDEAVIAWGDLGLRDLNTQQWDAGKDSLPAPSPSTYGRATRLAAGMLLANLYLNDSVYTGTPNWSGALTEAQTVITSSAGLGYGLDSNYRRMFMADNNTSPEILFAITQDGTHTQSYGGVTFLVH